MKNNNSSKPQVNFKLIYVMALLLFASCAKRNLVYFSDLPKTTDFNTPISNYMAPKIQTNDILTVSVSSLNAESNVLFNNVLLPQMGNSANVIAAKVNEGYLVDKDGFINFPVIGKVMIRGLTREEATDKLTDLIKEHVKNPIVNVRYFNFKVTVIGEVARPSSFVIPNERITVLEALGLAGDMTAFGRRENVLVVREKDGIRSTARININNKDVLNSPYFYLQQNDIVYVEPDNKVKVAQTNPGNRFIGIMSTLIASTALVIIAVYNNNN